MQPLIIAFVQVCLPTSLGGSHNECAKKTDWPLLDMLQHDSIQACKRPKNNSNGTTQTLHRHYTYVTQTLHRCYTHVTHTLHRRLQRKEECKAHNVTHFISDPYTYLSWFHRNKLHIFMFTQYIIKQLLKCNAQIIVELAVVQKDATRKDNTINCLLAACFITTTQ